MFTEGPNFPNNLETAFPNVQPSPTSQTSCGRIMWVLPVLYPEVLNEDTYELIRFFIIPLNTHMLELIKIDQDWSHKYMRISQKSKYFEKYRAQSIQKFGNRSQIDAWNFF